MDAIRGGGAEARRRSAGRRVAALLGADRASATGWTSTVVNHSVDPTFALHDGRPRRQDPHGLLQPVRDGRAGRAEGPITSVAFANDPGLRPARHRHAVGRADEPEPLPGRRDPLSADAPPGLAGDGGGRQDAGQQQHDRPRGARARAASCRRCRSASSGSRRACSTAPAASAARRAPAPASCAATARVWTTDKDGTDHGPAGRRDHRAHRQRPGRALPRADRRSSARPYYTRIDAPATPEQKAALEQTVARSGHGHRRWPASRSPRKLTNAPGNDAPIGGLKVVTDERLVRRPAVRAPRTSTRSTPRASSDEAHLNRIVERGEARSSTTP